MARIVADYCDSHVGQHAVDGFSDTARDGHRRDVLRVVRGERVGGQVHPWLLPMNIFLQGRATTAVVLGVTGGIIAAVVGCFEFVRRDVLT